MSRFKFRHNGQDFEVSGTYGHETNQVVTVTKLLPGAVRTLGVPGDAPSGVKVELAISVETEEELLLRLKQSYPDIVQLTPC